MISNIVVVLLATLCNKKIIKYQKKYVYIILAVLFSIIIAIRPEMTPDTDIYVRGFEQADISWLKNANLLGKYGSVFEYGYVALMICFKKIVNNSSFFFFITTLLGLFLSTFSLYRFSEFLESGKYSWNYYEVFSVYLTCYALLYNGISVRAGLSIALGLFFIVLMYEKKTIKAVLILLLAFSLHRTSILYIFIYFIIKFIPVLRKKTHYIMWVITGVLLFTKIGTIIFNMLSPIISKWMISNSISGYGYLTEAAIGGDLSGTNILKWLIYGLLIFFSIKDELYGKCLNLVMTGCFIMALLNGVTAASRAYDLFYMFSVPMYCLMYHSTMQVISNQKIKKVVVYVLLGMNYYIMLRLCILNYL